VDWEVDALLAARQKLNADSPVKISLNDMLVHCVARALIAEPRVNIHVKDDAVRQFKQAHVAVAIATDDGLFPATIYNADGLSVQEIASRRADLVARANGGELTRDDLAGATFTVSNLGMYGLDRFTAIINPPMGALLALGQAREQCVARDGQVETATVISATLSCDHRAIDGAVGAQFLAALHGEIEKLGRET
jgi:pyruvate dehydrogenase E2 component (dihydrolipoamide acetyltransferase)